MRKRKRVRLTDFPPEKIFIFWKVEVESVKIKNKIYALQRYLWWEQKTAYFLFDENNTLLICSTDDDTSICVAECLLELIPKNDRQYFFNRFYRP